MKKKFYSVQLTYWDGEKVFYLVESEGWITHETMSTKFKTKEEARAIAKRLAKASVCDSCAVIETTVEIKPVSCFKRKSQ